MKINALADGTLLYRCPCGDTHAINSAKWSWNGDVERPTFSPSVLVTSGHYVPRAPGEPESCWCAYAKENPEEKLPFGCYRCHSYVENGMVRFLADCTHALANQTVPIADWEQAPKESAQ